MKKKGSGFTLIECIITLVLLSLLLVISTSSWSVFFKQQVSHAQATQIFHTLQFARMEAIKRNKRVGICGINNALECSADWTNGYMVFVLAHAHLPREILYIERPSKLIPAHSGQVPFIKYGGDGRCLSRGTISVEGEKTTHKIILYDSGRIRQEQIPAVEVATKQSKNLASSMAIGLYSF